MKKIILIICYILVSQLINAQTTTATSTPTTTREHPTIALAGGIGVWEGLNYNGTAQYFASRRISLGGIIAFGKNSSNDKLTGDYYYTLVWETPQQVIVAPRIEIHPYNTETLDMYLAVTAGYGHLSYTDKILNETYFAFAGDIGLRYYFSKYIGFFGEGGFGNRWGTGILKAGLALKF